MSAAIAAREGAGAQSAPQPEDLARANLYGLIARLFHRAPDADLLGALGAFASGESGALAQAWSDLARMAAAATPDALSETYEFLFVGTGKAAVTPYAGAYLARSEAESPLAELRRQLAELGYSRLDDVHEPEDHFASLCEVMKRLILDRSEDLSEQKRFFHRWLYPAGVALCDAIDRADAEGFYGAVGRFTHRLLELDHEAFEMS